MMVEFCLGMLAGVCLFEFVLNVLVSSRQWHAMDVKEYRVSDVFELHDFDIARRPEELKVTIGEPVKTTPTSGAFMWETEQ